MLNIDHFEEEINVPENERNSFVDDATFKKFNTPSKIQSLWLTKHTEELVTADAELSRKRIIAMVNVWEFLDEFESTSS